MSQVVLYPRDEFSAEFRDFTEKGGFGNTPQRFMGFKYVFPALTQKDAEHGVEYDLRTALVLQQAAIRQELRSLTHDLTLKGIGASSGQRSHEATVLTETAEVVFDQIGLGSVQGAVRAWFNRYRGILDAVTHTMDLKKDGMDHGDVCMKTLVLSGTRHLDANGFSTEGLDMPTNASAIVLSTIRGKMSRNEVRHVLEKTTKVPKHYDTSPRWVFRANHPHTLYQNLGSPAATLYARFTSSNQKESAQKRMVEVPLDPVELVKGTKKVSAS